jgi:tetratricopeptide (TPR) repeat protein
MNSRRLLVAVLVSAALACEERAPRTVVAAPADAERPPGVAAPGPRDADAGDANAGGTATPPAGPGGAAGAGPGAPTAPEALVAQVDAMKADLAKADKPLEILVTLGGLYFQQRRYAEAIDWYAQASALAEPAWKAYLALPAKARAAPAPKAAAEACTRTAERGFSELTREARTRAKRDAAGAAACYREALAPAIVARIQRGNALLLAGEADLAIAEHEAVLARVPDQPEALWFLGLALAETGAGDAAKLTRAKEVLRRVGELQPEGPHAADLPLALAEVDRRLAAATSARR